MHKILDPWLVRGGAEARQGGIIYIHILITGVGGFVTVYEVGVNGIEVSTRDPNSEISLSIILVLCRTNK
jgi:hypothetical protein